MDEKAQSTEYLTFDYMYNFSFGDYINFIIIFPKIRSFSLNSKVNHISVFKSARKNFVTTNYS